MAGRRQKARLGDIGGLRLGLGARQLLVEALQFLGALAHAPLQALVGRRQGFLGLDRLGDVRIGRDDAAVRQPRRTDFDDPHRRMNAQPPRLLFVELALDALGDEIVDRSRPVDAAFGVETHDLVKADAGPQQRRRHVEQVAELAVPADQPEVAVEDGDSLARMIECVLQQVAVGLQRRRGVVDEF